MKQVSLMKKQSIFISLLLMLCLLTGCNYTDISTHSQAQAVDIPAATIEMAAEPQSILGELKAHFINVEQGDSSLIILPDNQTILIDAGNNQYGKTVVSYLENNGISKIDYFVLTHPDADHVGGADTVINALEIGSIYMPDITSTTRTFEDVLTAIKNKGITISIAEAGKELFNYGNLRAVFVAPVSKTNDTNNMSAVLHLTYGMTSFLFTGDAEQQSEADILDSNADIKADILKVGHHGSKSSSTESFIKAVSPKYAIICAGKNSYGHPNQKVLDRLDNYGVNINRTDELGNIIVESDGENITINRNSTVIQPNAPPVVTVKPSAEPTAKSEINNQNQEVFVSKTGKKYHVSNCRYLNKSKIAISLEDAKKNYDGCSVCNPPS